LLSFEHIPFVSAKGCNYSIEFVEDENEWGIKIITISIILLNQKNDALSYKDLLSIGSIFKNYLVNNKNAVLIYICDDTELNMNKSNKNLIPQAYRNKLFNLIFERLDKGKFHKANTKLENNGDIQYLAFIGFASNRTMIDKCANLVIDKLGS